MSTSLVSKRVPEVLAQQLGDVLARQFELYGEVQQQLAQRKDALRQADLERYGSLANAEQRVLAEVFELDTRRTALSVELTALLGLAKGASILEIAARLEESPRARLEGLRALLKHMAGIIQTVRSALAQTGVYGRHGRVALGATVASTIDLRS